jgi:hypothetical protein
MMEMMMPEKFTTLQQIKKLDEERAKLLESVTFLRFSGHWIKRLGALPVRG